MSDLYRAIILFCLITPLCLSGSALRAQEKPTGVEVEMVQSDEVKLPAEFQVALYENLVQQLQKKGKFEHVYRDGDPNAAERPGTVVLHSTVKGFKQGSERTRQVTTVAGATSIRIHCRFSDTEGHTLLERDIEGKVRFFGGNLKATSDFAKKAASAAEGITIPANLKAADRGAILDQPPSASMR
jgi:hypothetical protein